MSLEQMKDTALRSHVCIAHKRSRRWVDRQAYAELLRWHEATGCKQ